MDRSRESFAQHIGVPVQQFDEVMSGTRAVIAEMAWLFSEATVRGRRSRRAYPLRRRDAGRRRRAHLAPGHPPAPAARSRRQPGGHPRRARLGRRRAHPRPRRHPELVSTAPAPRGPSPKSSRVKCARLRLRRDVRGANVPRAIANQAMQRTSIPVVGAGAVATASSPSHRPARRLPAQAAAERQRMFRCGGSVPCSGDLNVRGVNSSRLVMLALLPVARITNRPSRSARTSDSWFAFR